MASNHRYRLDREGLDAVCAAWWAGEHPEGPPWSSTPDETRAKIALDIKGLLKRRRAATPGDVAALAAVEAATTASAERAAARRERLAWLDRQPTPYLLNLLQAARPSGFASWMNFEIYAGAMGDPNRTFSLDEIKAILATREHVPNRAEREAARRTRATSARKQRQRPPPPRRR